MMRNKPWVVPVVISLLPAFVIIIHLIDLHDVYWGKYDYPFGTEFYSKYSIYHSKTVYVAYNITHVISLILVIFFAFKYKWIPFLCVLLLAIVLFMYPIYFNT